MARSRCQRAVTSVCAVIGADYAEGFFQAISEVGIYISKLQAELYDKIQGSLVGGCFFVSDVGVFLLLAEI
jgi:hypothetical protein